MNSISSSSFPDLNSLDWDFFKEKSAPDLLSLEDNKDDELFSSSSEFFFSGIHSDISTSHNLPLLEPLTPPPSLSPPPFELKELSDPIPASVPLPAQLPLQEQLNPVIVNSMRPAPEYNIPAKIRCMLIEDGFRLAVGLPPKYPEAISGEDSSSQRKSQRSTAEQSRLNIQRITSTLDNVGDEADNEPDTVKDEPLSDYEINSPNIDNPNPVKKYKKRKKSADNYLDPQDKKVRNMFAAKKYRNKKNAEFRALQKKITSLTNVQVQCEQYKLDNIHLKETVQNLTIENAVLREKLATAKKM